MKKVLLASVFGFAFVGSAIAADMSVPVKAAPAVVRPACAQFGGFYLGGNVGWGYLAHNYQDRDGLATQIDDDLANATNSRTTKSGWNAGVQGGYNYQSGCTLFGVEADWSWSDTNASAFYTDGDQPLPTDTVSVSSKMRWFGTVRARSGVIVDNVLLYATGGLAYANFARSVSFFNDGGAGTTLTIGNNNTRWGWTAGVGTEWAFAPNWSLKSEVLYMRFEEDTFNAVGIANIGNVGQTYRLSSQNEAWISRIGVNYRFGGPVVARY
jgi:outer membrane immunogenic protein